MSEQSRPEDVAQFERKSWSVVAEVYPETISTITRQNLSVLIEPIGVTEGMQVLDIGCGPGNISNDLAAMGADVTGIDFAGPMVDVAGELGNWRSVSG